MNLFNEIQGKIKELDTCIRLLKKRGQEKAKAESEYRIALNQEILIQRENGLPVTIISDVCRGNKEIAKLKTDRDIAEVLYQTVLEKIYAIKLEIRILEGQLQREYGNTR